MAATTKHKVYRLVVRIGGLAPPNEQGIELPAARDLTTVQPTAARACPLPMRTAGGW